MAEKLSNTYRYTCSCCGKTMTGLLMSIACNVPDNWLDLSEAERTQSQMNSDFCYLKWEDGTVERYIRCIMELPVPSLDDVFTYGVWMSISEESWDIHLEGSETGTYEKDSCFGFLGNAIRTFPQSRNLHADVCFREGDKRPVVILHHADHPLVAAQENGLRVEQAEAIIAGLH